MARQQKRGKGGGSPKTDRIQILNGPVIVEGDHFRIFYEVIISDKDGGMKAGCPVTVYNEKLKDIIHDHTGADGSLRFVRILRFQKYGSEIITRVRINNSPAQAINTVRLRLGKPLLVAGPQPEIRAGQGPVQLNILSLDDPEGDRNYTCKIVSFPQLGVVKNGGIYYPPKRVYETEQVTIESCLNIDRAQNIKITLSILQGDN